MTLIKKFNHSTQACIDVGTDKDKENIQEPTKFQKKV